MFDDWPTLVAAAIALVAVAVIVVLLISHRSRSRGATAAARRIRGLELVVAEQTARLRMVRELHDISSRALSEMIDGVDAARMSVTADPAVAIRSATRAIETGRTTLADLRRIAGVAGEGEQAGLAAPALSELPALFDEFERDGLRIDVHEAGTAFALREGAEIAVFRILQHALANALHHGGPGTTARVSFRWTDTGLQMLVDDDGVRASAARGDDPDAQRYGIGDDARALTEQIIGAEISEMRARAALFGGSFEATRVPGVGFSVAAFLPTVRHHNGIHGVPLRG